MRIRDILLAAVVVNLALTLGPRGTESAIGVETGSPSPVDLAEGSDCTLVVFMDPDCPRCGEVDARASLSPPAGLPDFELLWVLPEEELVRGGPDAITAAGQVTYADSLFSLFQVTAVPAAVLIQGNRVVGSGGIPANADVRSFARSCDADGAVRPAVAVQDRGSDLRLSALFGGASPDSREVRRGD